MHRTLLLALLALAAGLVLAACGDSDSSTTTTPRTGGGAEGTVVEMKGIAFNPSTITVKVGERITWVNEDSVPHDAVATSGESFRSDLFDKGQSFSFTPTRAGTIKYVCTVHPGMDGEIVVEQ